MFVRVCAHCRLEILRLVDTLGVISAIQFSFLSWFLLKIPIFDKVHHHINSLISLHIHWYRYFRLDEVLSEGTSGITLCRCADTSWYIVTCSCSLELATKYAAHSTWGGWRVDRLSSLLLFEILKLYKFHFLSWALLRKDCSLLLEIFRIPLCISYSAGSFLTLDDLSFDWRLLLISLLCLGMPSFVFFDWHDAKEWVEHISLVSFLKIKRWLTDNTPCFLVTVGICHGLSINSWGYFRDNTVLLWY